MSQLKTSLVQCDLRWEDPQANHTHLEALLGDLDSRDTDLIVLPEMFATGFTMNSREMAQPMKESQSVAWLQTQAKARGCVVTGSVAIVTGGAHGIGKAYCIGLAREGAKVVIADLDLAAAEDVAKIIEDTGGDAIALRVDVSDATSTLEMARVTAEKFGTVDILINNAAHNPKIETAVETNWSRLEQFSIGIWNFIPDA